MSDGRYIIDTLNVKVVSDYHKEVIESSSVGKIDAEVFKKIFRLAFPERPEDKLDALIEKIRNVEKTDGSIRKLSRRFDRF